MARWAFICGHAIGTAFLSLRYVVRYGLSKRSVTPEIAASGRLAEGPGVRCPLLVFEFIGPTLLAVLLLTGCDQSESIVDRTPVGSTEAPLRFVGSDACAGCHVIEAERWHGSDHDRAMEEPSLASVVGEFDGSVLEHFGRSWRFLRDEEAYVVESTESGRPPERLQVAYTFGVEPLQQYLVERPDGRFQALPVAWDARPVAKGGQKWIDLQPDEKIPRKDPLHWDRLSYNWNSQCASCHSTNLKKGYDEGSSDFESQWSSIDVGCEACHGPGSRHLLIQQGEIGDSDNPDDPDNPDNPEARSGFGVYFESWNPDAWQRAEKSRIASRVVARERDAQIDACAPCHSRRTQIVETAEIGAPFLDGHRPRLLDPGLYFADGQIRDEVYVWGSFLQSRMASAGVRCNDCHDPHSLDLRREGNSLCTGCHAPDAFDVMAHHGHEVGSEAADCVTCHMPERMYMKVDGRRDHSFPIPRPDRSATLGAPDVCRNCHSDRGADWATAQINSWREEGTVGPAHWSDHLVIGSSMRSDSDRWLEIALSPGLNSFVRANAWARYAEAGAIAPPVARLRERLREGTELERLAIIDVARLLPPAVQASLLRPLLEDDRLAIRIGAAEALIEMPLEDWRPADRAILARALREYRGAQEANAERPEAQVSLGLLAARYGEFDAAREAYGRAIAFAPYFVPAFVNLADLERVQGRNQQAVALLRIAVELVPNDARVRYAMGMALHRAGEPEQALVALARAAEEANDQPRFVLGWALALDAAGQRDEAISALADAIDRGTKDADLQQALVTLLRDQGELQDARERAEDWLRSRPGDPRAEALLRELGELGGMVAPGPGS